MKELTALVLQRCLLLIPVFEVDQCVLVIDIGDWKNSAVSARRDFWIQSRAYC